jgi:hypothetical protein
MISDTIEGVKPAYTLRQGEVMWVEVTTAESFSDFLEDGKIKDTDSNCGISISGSVGQELQRYGIIVDPSSDD